MPQVSVIIPAYNAAQFIPEAISSILEQTFKDFEIVVVDDGSTDNTKVVISDLQARGNIRYFYKPNGGQSSARNLGMREAGGELLAFLDADDLWMPDFLEKMVKKIDEGFDWVVCDHFRDSLDLQTGKVSRSLQKRAQYDGWDTNSLLKDFLKEDGVGSPGKMMVRREVIINKEILFDGRTDNREDWDFCIQLLSKGCRPGWVREPLFVYRIRSDNTNVTRKRKSKTLYSTFFLIEKNSALFLHNGMAATLADHYFRLSRRFWNEARDLKKSLQCMMRNVRYGGLGELVALVGRKAGLR